MMTRKHDGTHKDIVASLPIPPADRNKYLARERVKRKEEEFLSSKRCPKCWFSTTNGSCSCICSSLPPLPFTTNIKFIVYMHHIELFNAGDDAKLLMCAAEDRTEFYVFGREGDEDRMVKEVFENGGLERTLLLFPSEKAETVEGVRSSYVEKWCHRSRDVPVVEDAMSKKATLNDKPLQIMLVDGTWRQAKAMAKDLDRIVKAHLSSCPTVTHVKLLPDTISVYARTQSQADRICTIEALALFLKECGEVDEVTSALIEYVKINNDALRPSKKKNS